MVSRTQLGRQLKLKRRRRVEELRLEREERLIAEDEREYVNRILDINSGSITIN